MFLVKSCGVGVFTINSVDKTLVIRGTELLSHKFKIPSLQDIDLISRKLTQLECYVGQMLPEYDDPRQVVGGAKNCWKFFMFIVVHLNFCDIFKLNFHFICCVRNMQLIQIIFYDNPNRFAHNLFFLLFPWSFSLFHYCVIEWFIVKIENLDNKFKIFFQKNSKVRKKSDPPSLKFGGCGFYFEFYRFTKTFFNFSKVILARDFAPRTLLVPCLRPCGGLTPHSGDIIVKKWKKLFFSVNCIESSKNK